MIKDIWGDIIDKDTKENARIERLEKKAERAYEKKEAKAEAKALRQFEKEADREMKL